MDFIACYICFQVTQLPALIKKSTSFVCRNLRNWNLKQLKENEAKVTRRRANSRKAARDVKLILENRLPEMLPAASTTVARNSTVRQTAVLLGYR